MPIDSFVTILPLMASGSPQYLKTAAAFSLCPRTEGRTDGRYKSG